MSWRVRDKLRRVATVYGAAAEAGQPPTLAVARRFRVSKSAAANLVARARGAGLLPATSRGRATPGATRES